MTTPTLNDLYTSILADLRNKLGTSSVIGKAVIIAFSVVQAAKLKIFYLTNAFTYKNVFPDLADPESLNGTLSRFGFVKLGRYPNAATAGEYTVAVSGSIGATIAPGTTYKSLDTATSPDKLFVLDTLFTFTGTSGSISLRALDLGANAALNVGDSLQVTQPIADVNSFGTVSSVDTTPLEAETTEEYREKVIAAYRLESQGGAKTDYREWSADAQGVRKVYPYAKSGDPGIIDLYVEANPDDSTDGYGTPSSAILDDVEEVVEFDPDTTKPLNERGRRPISAFQINYLPVNVLPVDIEITNLSDSSYISSIEDAIVSFLFNIRPFVDGADDPNDQQTDLLYETDIYGVVRSVLGNNATFESLTVEVDGNPITIYEFTDGDIPYLDNLT